MESLQWDSANFPIPIPIPIPSSKESYSMNPIFAYPVLAISAFAAAISIYKWAVR